MQATEFIRGLRSQRIHQRTGDRAMVRLYERQSQFEHDVRRLRRHGWHLESVTRSERTLPLDIVRCSAPGTILNVPRHRIEARYRYRPSAQLAGVAGAGRGSRFKNLGSRFAQSARGTLRRGTHPPDV